MNKLTTIFILTSLVLSLPGKLAFARTPPSAPATPIYSDVVTSKEVAQSISLIGKLQSKQYVSIASEVAAKVTKIAVEPNQTVKKGQLLVSLDNGKANALLAEAKAYLNDQERTLKDYQRLINKQAITQTELDAQTAAVTIGKARLLAAQVFVDNHRLLAPFDGTIGLLDFSEGKNVSIGETLLTLDNLSQMTLDLSIPERYLSQVEIGMDLRVRLLLDNKSQKLKPGMLMSARVVFRAINEPIIAVQSLEYAGTKRFVYVIGDDNKVERREVVLGARINDQAIIESGLEIGERIVVQGLVNMRDGLSIRDLNAKEAKSKTGKADKTANVNKDDK